MVDSTRVESLLAVTGELGAAHTREAIAQLVVERGFDAVGASHGALWLLDGDNQLTLLAASRGSIDKWSSVPLDLDAPLPRAVSTGEPVFLESPAELARRFPASYARSAETISSPDSAYANLPLIANGKPVGGIAVTYERRADLDATLRTFLAILARQCGEALVRVQAATEAERALREERQALALAEEATRAREEILSVVSHDLRNPLGTIVMGASALLHLTEGGDDPKTQRARGIAERIHRQGERMTRLIDDLVDFAAIQAGDVAIERKTCAPEALVARAAELLGPLATERNVGFETQVEPGLPAIACDADRGVQIFSNLTRNSMKVTAKNGRITIGARQCDGEVVFFVRDTGPGIAADELPRLFERFWRSKNTSYKGAGLGISIAKGIVDAHDGRIWADSSPGAGTTFHFTLAPAR